MTISEARMVCELRLRQYSLRAIAETFFTKDDPSHGDPGEGDELLKEATHMLGRKIDDHPDDFIQYRWDRSK